MSEENTQEQPQAPVTDAFGEQVKKEGEEATAETATEETTKEDAKETPTQTIARLSRENGELAAKLTSSTELHTKKDSDIRALVDKVKNFEKNNGGAPEGGQAQEGDVPFKEIKTSKDLTEDEKDEMTDAEIKALDEMAVLKKTINEQALALAQSKKAPEGEVDVNATVKAKAVELASQDTDIANLIIEAFNGMKFNTKEMTADEINKAVEVVAGTVQGYKPPKEDGQGAGKGKPAGGGTKTDPYGVDKIVESVVKQGSNGGTYSL